jgi:hypothetical protein
MILARISAHLKRQDWTAIGIEFAIVVLGVFVGIQVSNWNAARVDERLGRAYTQRLTEDLNEDLAAHRAVVAYYREVLASVERANALLAEPHPDARELVVHAYRASEVVNAPRTRSTWDEIVSSGDTGLLPRAALSSGLADYFAGDGMRDAYDRMVGSAYRERLRSSVPLQVQQAIRAGCSDITIGSRQVIGFVAECTVAVDDQVLAATASALRADPQIATGLRNQHSLVVSTIGVLTSSVEYLEAGIAALGGDPAPAGGAAP